MAKRIIKVISQKESRKKYKKNKNFRYQINKRLIWMGKYLKDKKIFIEIGSGNGLSKKILNEKIITTDIKKNAFIDRIVDMNNIRLPSRFYNKVDVVIFNHSLHHSTNPMRVLKNVSKIFLKKGGFILINEPELSVFFKFFLKICNHERYDENINNINKKNFWFENNATGKILFGKQKIGNKFLNDFKIVENSVDEFFIFLNSSGNGVNAPYIKLNDLFLKIVNLFDNVLTKCFPQIFALNRKIVLKKIF